MYSWPLNNMGLNRTGSTYTWIFFNSKYYSTTWSEVGWIGECGIADTKDLLIFKADCSYMRIFDSREVGAPNPCAILGSTVVPKHEAALPAVCISCHWQAHVLDCLPLGCALGISHCAPASLQGCRILWWALDPVPGVQLPVPRPAGLGSCPVTWGPRPPVGSAAEQAAGHPPGCRGRAGSSDRV